jgi:hypothetical protein
MYITERRCGGTPRCSDELHTAGGNTLATAAECKVRAPRRPHSSFRLSGSHDVLPSAQRFTGEPRSAVPHAVPTNSVLIQAAPRKVACVGDKSQMCGGHFYISVSEVRART